MELIILLLIVTSFGGIDITDDYELLDGCWEDQYENIYCDYPEDELTIERFLFGDFYFGHEQKSPVPFGLTLVLSITTVIAVIVIIKKKK